VACFLGIDIGGTKTAVSVGDQEARVLGSRRFPTSSCPNPGRVLELVARCLLELLDELEIARPEIQRAGVSCGGPLDSRRGLVLSPPNLPGWDAVPVCEILSHRLSVPVRLENDANASALAEWMFGAGQGTQHMVFLTCSTGMGAGLILDGRLYHGRRDLAGEAGHIRLTDDGPMAYGKAGCFEAWASGAGIAAQTGRQAEEIGAAALAGDPEAIAVIRHAGEMLGRGIAILCDVLNPELVVCGTMAIRLGDLLLEPARRVLAQEALDPCPVVPAALGDELGLKAALCVAMV